MALLASHVRFALCYVSLSFSKQRRRELTKLGTLSKNDSYENENANAKGLMSKKRNGSPRPARSYCILTREMTKTRNDHILSSVVDVK